MVGRNIRIYFIICSNSHKYFYFKIHLHDFSYNEQSTLCKVYVFHHKRKPMFPYSVCFNIIISIQMCTLLSVPPSYIYFTQ